MWLGRTGSAPDASRRLDVATRRVERASPQRIDCAVDAVAEDGCRSSLPRQPELNMSGSSGDTGSTRDTGSAPDDISTPSSKSEKSWWRQSTMVALPELQRWAKETWGSFAATQDVKHREKARGAQLDQDAPTKGRSSGRARASISLAKELQGTAKRRPSEPQSKGESRISVRPETVLIWEDQADSSRRARDRANDQVEARKNAKLAPRAINAELEANLLREFTRSLQEIQAQADDSLCKAAQQRRHSHHAGEKSARPRTSSRVLRPVSELKQEENQFDELFRNETQEVQPDFLQKEQCDVQPSPRSQVCLPRQKGDRTSQRGIERPAHPRTSSRALRPVREKLEPHVGNAAFAEEELDLQHFLMQQQLQQ